MTVKPIPPGTGLAHRGAALHDSLAAPGICSPEECWCFPPPGGLRIVHLHISAECGRHPASCQPQVPDLQGHHHTRQLRKLASFRPTLPPHAPFAMARVNLAPLTAALLLAVAALLAAPAAAGLPGKAGLTLLGSVPFPAAEQVSGGGCRLHWASKQLCCYRGGEPSITPTTATAQPRAERSHGHPPPIAALPPAAHLLPSAAHNALLCRWRLMTRRRLPT